MHLLLQIFKDSNSFERIQAVFHNSTDPTISFKFLIVINSYHRRYFDSGTFYFKTVTDCIAEKLIKYM